MPRLLRNAAACGALLTVLVPAAASATTFAPPVLVSSTQAHRETSLALNPKDPKSMFLCDPSGVPAIGDNQSYFHATQDGGATWKFMRVEGGQTDARNYAYEGGDCDVAYDDGGTMYSADTWLGSLSVGHSTDGGKTWDGTPLAAAAPVVDRPWLVGGPAGTVHFTYQDVQFGMPSAIWYVKSTDYGKTFSAPIPVTTVALGGAFTWEGNLVVAPNGQDMYLVYNRRQNGAVNVAPTSEIVSVAASHDGGLTWASHEVATVPDSASYLYSSLAMDAKQNLYVVYSSRTETDQPIWLAASTDKGVTWSAPRPLSRNASGYSPWIASDPAGHLAIAWYGTPDPTEGSNTKTKWFFYWARVEGATTPNPTITTGTTTTAPIFTGASDIPEFENVRLDADGLMHLGMSAFFKPKTGGARWAAYYQRELPS
jgi:hypothetical protein